jgi:hypothetical protein
MDVRNTLSLAGGLLALGAVGYYWGGFGQTDSPLRNSDPAIYLIMMLWPLKANKPMN